jgi:hypothetical protein
MNVCSNRRTGEIDGYRTESILSEAGIKLSMLPFYIEKSDKTKLIFREWIYPESEYSTSY